MVPELSTIAENEYGDEIDWTAGALGGVVAGGAFGLLIQFVLAAMPAIGAIYGASGAYAGWILHLIHSSIFGVLYAAVAQHDPLRGYIDEVVPGIGLGIGYGMVIWAVFFVFLRPVWLQITDHTGAAPVQYLEPLPLSAHIVFGAVLGGIYAWID